MGKASSLRAVYIVPHLTARRDFVFVLFNDETHIERSGSEAEQQYSLRKTFLIIPLYFVYLANIFNGKRMNVE